MRSFVAAACAAALLAVGCGKTRVEGDQFEVDPKYKEAHQLTEGVSATLTALEDGASDPAAFAALFAEPGMVPKDRAPFAGLKFSADSLPRGSGDNLEFDVLISRKDNKEPPRNANWKFRKSGDSWKIVDAPVAVAPAAAAAALQKRTDQAND